MRRIVWGTVRTVTLAAVAAAFFLGSLMGAAVIQSSPDPVTYDERMAYYLLQGGGLLSVVAGSIFLLAAFLSLVKIGD